MPGMLRGEAGGNPSLAAAFFVQQGGIGKVLQSLLGAVAHQHKQIISDYYFFSLDRGPNPSKLLQQLLILQPEQQLSVYKTLKSQLVAKGILQPSLRG